MLYFKIVTLQIMCFQIVALEIQNFEIVALEIMYFHIVIFGLRGLENTTAPQNCGLLAALG